MAMKDGLKLAEAMGCNNVQAEGDCMEVINARASTCDQTSTNASSYEIFFYYCLKKLR
ncbi:MAG: hypothetical protein DI620_04555 [Haemophilus parainfluenzae]|nr:MAG: hypothetical protein DI620_04555 [Haemophilus parainfluenzae]